MAMNCLVNMKSTPLEGYWENEETFQEEGPWIKNSLLGWVTPRDITYPTPPYMSIREDAPSVYAQHVNRRLLDLIEKLNSNDTSGMTQGFGNETDDKYTRTNSTQSAIRDNSNKWIVFENGRLFAKMLDNANMNMKATVKLSYYSPMEDGKKPVTLKIVGTNYYVTYQSDNLRLEQMKEENLNSINSSMMKFLFLQSETSTVTKSFEPATAPRRFISTSARASTVTVQPSSVNTVNKEFVITSEFWGSFLNVGHKRISLQPPSRQTILKYMKNGLSDNAALQTKYQTRIPYWQRHLACA
ncbi:uncharacterized protein O3C94_008806 [Discoglossus pictus]